MSSVSFLFVNWVCIAMMKFKDLTDGSEFVFTAKTFQSLYKNGGRTFKKSKNEWCLIEGGLTVETGKVSPRTTGFKS